MRAAFRRQPSANPPPQGAATPRRKRRGQTLVEFALTLPILLLLFWGIIEFGRLFQAWITIQNAARTAARYAVTGAYDQQIFQDVNNPWTPNTPGSAPWADGTGSTSGKLGDGVPCKVNAPSTDKRGPFQPVGTNVNGDIFHYWRTGSDEDSYFAARYNGIECDPFLDEHRWLRQDVLRLVSITNAARTGAGGLSLQDWMRIPGTGINTEPNLDGSELAGWFHVFICSTRPSLTDQNRIANNLPRYRNSLGHVTTTSNQSVYGYGATGIRLCTIEEEVKPDGVTDMNALATGPGGIRYGVNQFDAGGPGDFVEIIVYFNHPLITPLGFGRPSATGPYILLQARRTMINESFRTARVLDLPNQGGPTWTPIPTTNPLQSRTPTRTLTRTTTATQTPSRTPSQTVTPSATPQCTALSFVGDPTLVGQFVQVQIRNNNPGPVFIKSVRLGWTINATYPNIYPVQYKLSTQFPHWSYDSNLPRVTSGTVVDASRRDWNPGTAPDFAVRSIPGSGAISTWQAQMANGPADLNSIYTRHDFSTIQIVVDWGTSASCTLSYTGINTPTPITRTPTRNPVCTRYQLTFVTFQTFGVVRFQFANNDTIDRTPVSIVGFDLSWRSYFNGMKLTRVAAKGATAFSTDTVNMWSLPAGTETPPTSGRDNDPEWGTSPVIDGGTSQPLWVDFDGTNQNLQSQFPGLVSLSDFNGTRVYLNNGCVIELPPSATPIGTATTTLTPSRTLTRTRTTTLTPSNTVTASRTFTPSSTFTPSNTFTPTFTRTPTITRTPTNTPTRTFTATITLTPSRTFTRTPTFTPSKTFTPSRTFTPSQTFTPSKTRTPTATFTASNTFTATFTRTPSRTPSQTFTPSRTATFTATWTWTPSRTPTHTPTRTRTPTATFTLPPTATPTNTRVATQTNTPSFVETSVGND